jgi:hypothetical protein
MTQKIFGRSCRYNYLPIYLVQKKADVSAVRKSPVYSFPHYICLYHQTSVCNMEADKAVVPFRIAANIFFAIEKKEEDQQ